MFLSLVTGFIPHCLSLTSCGVHILVELQQPPSLTPLEFMWVLYVAHFEPVPEALCKICLKPHPGVRVQENHAQNSTHLTESRPAPRNHYPDMVTGYA